ncbi:nucleotidyl transferase AbiEii/AbiGii toxin family protein [Comamonas aquatica]|uniref:nucleotidyl transferase AbiEii/AbiGii toxin family protein n=1 Tax=Comamonas aquatica TaxID=225991 RepID=UPI00244A2E2C|nr:nucleotidyl transferase AbiEii/AbiGii toxin family protein [Comamonas aquatica]MDH1381293.1 nucleotidyl transferase AbiEii/AbiGii toxin family protein [Comamonas aquatica]MDH1641386.1 nucleotidyl transferase AbiEii/AbiGii toxin family protein [Comamonas aquatica]
MPESWFELSSADQSEALEVAAGRSGRPAHLLEKDIWVVWALSAIYDSPLGNTLTFKGGTSLSKVYKVIDRFSEDIDLTYDIRELVPDLLRDGNPIPASASQEKKITSAVRSRLPQWIEQTVQPVIEQALVASGLQAALSLAGKDNDKLIIAYPATKKGTGYAAATIQLEFGARATGEPHQRHHVACDIAPLIDGVTFPTAQPLVMAAERTFWEKATAAHVYCLQGRLRGDRYSRHWYDLAALAKTTHFASAASDHQLARQVAEHKSMFFAEKDVDGGKVDYFQATSGDLRLIPQGPSLDALEKDYAAMLEDGLLAFEQPTFEAVMASCTAIQDEVNRLARRG